MMIVMLEKRGSDDFGSGEFGASRGSRTHKGIDYTAPAGAEVLSPVDGQVTKHGYPYASDLSFRYVEITDPAGARHRLFYVSPDVVVGSTVSRQDSIGTVQDIAGKYNTDTRKMKNHIHYEIIMDGEYVNPEEFWT